MSPSQLLKWGTRNPAPYHRIELEDATSMLRDLVIQAFDKHSP